MYIKFNPIDEDNIGDVPLSKINEELNISINIWKFITTNNIDIGKGESIHKLISYILDIDNEVKIGECYQLKNSFCWFDFIYNDYYIPLFVELLEIIKTGEDVPKINPELSTFRIHSVFIKGKQHLMFLSYKELLELHINRIKSYGWGCYLKQ